MRIALLSDIHEDLPQLEKVLARAGRKGYDRLVCLGDISGFSIPHYTYQDSRNAPGCLALLREKEALIVPGNHDFHAARRIPVHSAGFDFPADWYDMDYREKEKLAGDRIYLHERDELDPLYGRTDRDFLRGLTEYRILDAGPVRLLLSHYVFPNLAGFQRGFYQKEEDFHGHFRFMMEKDCQISFTGHAHVRGVYTVTSRQFKHPGYGKVRLKEFPVCVGIHPVSRNKRRSGFCIFDVERHVLDAVKC
ncbi:MAG: metallophosphoesterase family protein [Bacteroidales bacterium]